MSVGMPGMDHGASPVGSEHDDGDLTVGWARQDPEAFAATLIEGDVFVVNVHVPNVGSIVGTDAAVPFDRLITGPRLPVGHDAVVAVYCETGRMSELAADALTTAGYRRVVELAGGMAAWRESGRVVGPDD